MNSRFMRYLKIVTAVHVGILFLLCVVPGFRALFKKKPDIMIPVQFLVQTGGAEQERDVEVQQEKEKKKKDPTVEKKKKEPDPIEKKQKLLKPEEIKKSNVRTVKGKKKQTKTLSPEEIAKRLAAGAIEGDRNTMPNDEERCLAIVHRALYDAWIQPGREEAGDAVTGIEIRFAADGSVAGRKIVNPSGNDIMDSSTMQAASAVKRIPGLSAGFLERHKFSIVIFFKVE